MISGNPSSKCQRAWLQIRPTFDTSICTEFKGLISKWGMLSPARLLMRGSRNVCPENFKFARFWERIQHFLGGQLANFYGNLYNL